jgi:hypothetical protein
MESNQNLLHKLNKYQIKLATNPTNLIYLQKEKYYKELIGGKSKDQKIAEAKAKKFIDYLRTATNKHNKKIIENFENAKRIIDKETTFQSIIGQFKAQQWTNDAPILNNDLVNEGNFSAIFQFLNKGEKYKDDKKNHCIIYFNKRKIGNEEYNKDDIDKMICYRTGNAGVMIPEL